MPRPLTAEKLDARVERRCASRRGRPQGSTVPLMQDPRRFETATWALATRYWGVGPYVAAGAIAALFSPRPIRSEMVGEFVTCLSSGIDHATFRGRAGRIARRAEASLKRCSEADIAWIAISSGALVRYVEGIADPAGLAYARDELHELGWGPTLTQIARRLQEALASNAPPREAPISRRAQQLAETLSLEL